MVIFMIAILISCDKDEFSEEDAYKYQKELDEAEAEIQKKLLADEAELLLLRDSLEKIGGIVNFAVNVVDAGDAGFAKSGKKVSGLWEAKVTVNQNGYVITKKTNESGIVVFPDLRIGEVAVHIEAEGFTTVDFIAQMNPQEWFMDDDNWIKPDDWEVPIDKEYYGVKRNASLMIPVFPMQGHTMSTVKGQVTYETDLTNHDPELAYDVEVIGVINTNDPLFQAKYIHNSFDSDLGPNGNNDDRFKGLRGQIVKIAYGNIVARKNTPGWNPNDPQSSAVNTEGVAGNITDANGMYELKVPSTADGLPIKILVSEIARDQRLLMNQIYDEWVYNKYHSEENGMVQSVRTIFSSEVNNGTATGCANPNGCLTPSDIPAVPAAYAVFSAPTATSNTQPQTPAVANVILSESGIEFIHVENQGGCYTQPPKVVIKQQRCAGCEVNTSAKAIANLSDGKVTSLTIVDPGKGYSPDAPINVEFYSPEDNTLGMKQAKATPTISYSLVNVPAVPPIKGYTGVPAVKVNADNGSGAAVAAVTSQYVGKVNVTEMGEGYTAIPDIRFEGGDPKSGAIALAVMSEKNPIHSVQLKKPFFARNLYFVESPAVIFECPGSGNDAKGVLELDNVGGIKDGFVYMTETGSGYRTELGLRPSVEIVSADGNGFGATAHAVVSAEGKVTGIVVDNQGVGYTTAPLVKIAAPYDENGVQATAKAAWARKAVALKVTDNGSGYRNDGTALTTVTVLEQTNVDPNADPDGDVTTNKVVLTTNDYKLIFDMRIEDIEVLNGGRGYKSAPKVLIVPKKGFGKNAAAEAVLMTQVEGFELLAGGSGYLWDENNFDLIVDADGDLGDARIVPLDNTNLGNGVIEKITVTDMGMGYTAAPRVKLLMDGNDAPTTFANDPLLYETQFKFKPVVANGKLREIKWEDPGVDFVVNNRNAWTLQIETYCATATAVAKAYPTAGQVVAVAVTNPGRGYTVNPIVEIVNLDGGGASLGGGKGATAEAELIDGRVSRIVVTNPGSGYYDPARVGVVITVPAYLETAFGIPTVDAKTGRITGVDFAPTGLYNAITTQGMGYDPKNPPTVTFYPAVPGEGSGATGVCVVNGSKIDRVVMTNQGSGYLGQNRYAAFTGAAALASDVLATGTSAVAGKGFSVIYLGGTHDYPLHGLNAQGGEFVTEAGKTYIKDIYLGTGKRTTDIQ